MKASSRLFAAAFAGLVLGWTGRAAEPKDESPFKPVAGGDAAAAAPNETMEFSGVYTIGHKTQIILFDKTAKKSRTIALKDTVDGITVLTYDAVREQVVVKVGGEEKVLTLRKSTGPTGAANVITIGPNPAASFNVPTTVAAGGIVQKVQPPPPPEPNPTPAAPVPVVTAPPANPAKPGEPAKPLSIARQEEEARMLVSDLLEIGMAQRKAYEEKQKAAAAAEQSGQAAPPKTDG